MSSTDLQTLLDMGFEKERAEIATKKTGSCKYVLETSKPNDCKLMLSLISSTRRHRLARQKPRKVS